MGIESSEGCWPAIQFHITSDSTPSVITRLALTVRSIIVAPGQQIQTLCTSNAWIGLSWVEDMFLQTRRAWREMSEVQKRQKSSGSTLAGNLFPANCLLYLAKTRVLNKETRECTQLPKQMRVCAKCPPDSFVTLALEKIVFEPHLICIWYSYFRD